jgi:RNA polymerase sigma factor (sigma-70 family)
MQNDKYTGDEGELLISLKKGDKTAFDFFYRKYSKGIYQKLYYMVKSPELSEEMLQDVFVRVWLKREDLDENRSFRNWALTIAQNLVYDYYLIIRCSNI